MTEPTQPTHHRRRLWWLIPLGGGLLLLLLWQRRQPDQQSAPLSNNTSVVGEATTTPSTPTVTVDSEGTIDPIATTAVMTTTTSLTSTPVTPVTATTFLTQPQFSAERIQLTPVDVSIDLTGVYTWSDKPSIHFEKWSNSGQKFIFSLFLPGYRVTESWIVGLDGQNLQRIITHSSKQEKWSPDDSKIAYQKVTGPFTEELWVVDLSTLTHTQFEPSILVEDKMDIHYVEQFWLDDQHLLYETYVEEPEQTNLWVHNVISNQVSEVIWSSPIETIYRISLSPNKTTITIDAVTDGLLLGELVKVGTEYQLNILDTLQEKFGTRVFWSPDSQQIALIASPDELDYGLRVWDIAARQKTDWYSPNSYVHDIDWAPDSQMVVVTFDPPGQLDAFSSEDDFTRYAEMRNLDGSSGVFLNNYDASATAWSSDGRYLTFIGSNSNRNDINLFDVFEVEVQ